MRYLQMRRVSLNLVLIVPFVLLVVLATALVGYLSYWNSQRAVQDVTESLRGEIITRIDEYLQVFLGTPHTINRTNATILREEWVAPDDQKALERYLWQQVQIFEDVTSIYFGNTDGGLVNAGREGGEDLLYLIATEEFQKGLFKKYAVDSNGLRTELLSAVPDFDARTRPWYTRAVERGNAVWSEVYILFTGHDIAISASRPVYTPTDTLLGVVSVDIFLSHLSDFLGSLSIGKTGQSFIMERSGLLIANSTGDQTFIPAREDQPSRRLDATESSSSLTRAVAEELTRRYGDYKEIRTNQDITFRYMGEPHALHISPLTDQYGLDWLIVVAIPEIDFMAQINANNRLTIALIGLAMLIAISIGILTARWIAAPVAHMSATARAVSEGKWQQKTTTAWIKEIDELTASFNHMNQKTKEMIGDLTGEITRRTRLEKELENLIRQLNTANADLKRFAEISAHHLQEPARRLGSYTKLLRSGLDALREGESSDAESDIAIALRYIEEGANSLHVLLRDIQLYLAASEPRGQVVLLETEGVVQSVIEDLDEKIKKTGATIEVGSLPSLQMDRQRLKDVFSILLSNALYFVDPEVIPSIIVQGEKVGSNLQFQVSDNGIGIPDQYKRRVFGVFERLQPRKGPSGTGIGLAVVRRIIESCQGRVWIEDSMQGGTSVYFELPLT